MPVSHYNSLIMLLQLPHFGQVLQRLDFNGRKNLALHLVTNALDNETYLSTQEQVEAVLVMLAPLIADQTDQPLSLPDSDDFAEEQNLMARMIHLLTAQDTDLDQQYRMLTAARKQFGSGGARRISFTIPPLIYEAFKLARKYFDAREQVKDIARVAALQSDLWSYCQYVVPIRFNLTLLFHHLTILNVCQHKSSK